jgi:hypothetical protein
MQYASHSLSTRCVRTCLFRVVEKSGTSCYHLVTRLMRSADSQQVVSISLISSACNKMIPTSSYSNVLRTTDLYERISLVGKIYRHQPRNKVITTCSRLVTTTRGTSSANTSYRPVIGLTTTLLQLVCRSVTTCMFLGVCSLKYTYEIFGKEFI